MIRDTPRYRANTMFLKTLICGFGPAGKPDSTPAFSGAPGTRSSKLKQFWRRYCASLPASRQNVTALSDPDNAPNHVRSALIWSRWRFPRHGPVKASPPSRRLWQEPDRNFQKAVVGTIYNNRSDSPQSRLIVEWLDIVRRCWVANRSQLHKHPTSTGRPCSPEQGRNRQ